jgi:5-methylcytosine-specific restriction endonuclease McrA
MSWQKIRSRVLSEQPFCYCGAPAVDVDHKVARAIGGSDERDNLHALCKRCHGLKTAMELRQQHAIMRRQARQTWALKREGAEQLTLGGFV